MQYIPHKDLAICVEWPVQEQKNVYFVCYILEEHIKSMAKCKTAVIPVH